MSGKTEKQRNGAGRGFLHVIMSVIVPMTWWFVSLAMGHFQNFPVLWAFHGFLRAGFTKPVQ